MPDDATNLILGDAAVDATTEGRRGLRRRRGKKRAGDRVLTHCENCGSPLTGEFCASCGQHAIDYRRSLWAVMIDAADSFFNWDTKFFKSLGILLVRPWKLTNDFNAGRRARYVHPLRLYLLGSIVFFLTFKLIKLDDHVIELGPQDRAQIATALGKLVGPDSVLTADQQAKVESVRGRLAQGTGEVTEEEKGELQDMVRMALATKMKDKFEKGERARLRAGLKRLPEVPKAPNQDEIRAQVARELSAAGVALPSASPAPPGSISEARPPPPADAPVDIAEPASPPPLPTPRSKPKPGIHFTSGDPNKPRTPFENWMETQIKNKVGEDGTRGKLFLQTLLNNIPTMMLCCIPLFALVLKFLYLGKRRYYVEHLVYALHIHTFVYVSVTLIVLCAMGLARFSDTARVLFSVFAGLTVFVLVFLSIRRVYGQGWFFSALKFVIGGIVYLVVLSTAIGVTAFVTLLLPD